jgi:hypothetical protein
MKVQKQGFGITDLEFSVYEPFPDVDNKISQTLSRLLGWDDLSNQYRSILVDSDGRVLVSTSPTKADSGNNSVVTVDTGGDTLLQANSSRKSYAIYNIGTEIVYLRFGSTPLTSSGLPLSVGGFISDDIYTGEITAIVAANTSDVRIVEFE